MSQIRADELRDVVHLATIVLGGEEYDPVLKESAYGVLCNIAKLDILSLEERWTLYKLLERKLFVSTGYDRFDEAVDDVYDSIYLYVEKQMPEELLTGSVKVSEESPVIIVTSQILSENHAPTRSVLDYAYTLQTMLDIPVQIINDAGLHYRQFPYMEGVTVFHFLKVCSEWNAITYKDALFGFFQVDCLMPDMQEITRVVCNIKKTNPRLVLNAGGGSLISDLCRGFTKTATIPFNTRIPRTMAEFPVIGRKLREADKTKIERLYPWQHIKEAIFFNYIMPDDSGLQKYTREMFQIPVDAWLLVSAGNRMAEELDRDFMRMLDELLDELPECYFLVIGGMDDASILRLTAGLTHMDRIRFAGDLEDGSQAIRLGNVYIQPTRKGGGRAAFEALYYGVPVIVTKYGDTWDVCGASFEVESYHEMAGRIKEYYNNREVYEADRKKSKERADVLEDMEGMFRSLLQKLKVDF